MIIEKEKEASYPIEKETQKQSGPSAERDLPPPYAEGSRPPGAVRSGGVDLNEHSVFRPATQQHVNCVSLFSRHNTLSGTYIIDAELAGLPLKNTVMGNNVIPNASFETRHGAISLNLATAGGTNVPNKTYVKVASRHGKVNVNLFALQPNKHICLDIHTRHAQISLFVPPNFSGALRLYSRSGNVRFLPAFAQRARVVTADDEGAFVLFGDGDLSSICEPTSDGLDFCSLSSRHGRLTIGVSGVDQLETSFAAGANLMKKLGALMFGPATMRAVSESVNSSRNNSTSHLSR